MLDYKPTVYLVIQDNDINQIMSFENEPAAEKALFADVEAIAGELLPQEKEIFLTFAKGKHGLELGSSFGRPDAVYFLRRPEIQGDDNVI